MENKFVKVTPLTSELNRIRNQFGFTRSEFSMMFNVTPYCIDSWCKRNGKPNGNHALQISNFLYDMSQTQKAIGLLVVNNRGFKKSEPLRTQMLIKRYCENNRLNLLTYKIISKDNLFNLESISDIIDTAYIKDNAVTDFVVFSKTAFLSDVLLNELKNAGIKLIHNLGNWSYTLDKISDD